MQKTLPWLISILLIVVASALLVSVAANRWLASDQLHALLEKKSSGALHATASFGPLQWGWLPGSVGLSCPQFRADGNGANALKKLEGGGLHGRLNLFSLLQGLWQIEEISFERAALHLDTSRHPNNPSLSIREQVKKEESSTLPSWIPSSLAINLIRANKADIFIALPSGKELALRGTHLEVHPEDSETRIEAKRGELTSSYLPQLNLEMMRCRIKPGLVDLTGANLAFPSGGILALEGRFPDMGESFLTGHWEQVSIATLAPKLAKQLVGNLDGDATIDWDDAGAMTIQGKVNADKTILLGIPMLESITQLTRMDAFRHLYLQQAHATFMIKNDGSSWRDVVLESQGLIKLSGEATVQKDSSFSGSFQLGLSSQIVKVIPGASMVFSKADQDGYYWTPLKVGGSLSDLTEDLTPRVAAAVMSNAGLLIQEGVKRGLKILGVPDAPILPSMTTNPPSQSTEPAPSADPAKAGLDIIGGFLK